MSHYLQTTEFTVWFLARGEKTSTEHLRGNPDITNLCSVTVGCVITGKLFNTTLPQFRQL